MILEETRARFDRAWEFIEPALDRAGNTHGKEDLWQLIESGGAQLWTMPKAAIVTEVVTYPKFKALRFWLIGGDLEQVKMIEPTICVWGKSVGCTVGEGIGRRGWARVNHGWTYLCDVMRKEL